MITEEERAKLKVGDVVYYVSDNDEGYPDYYRLTIHSINNGTLTCNYEIFNVQNSRLFVSLIGATERVIELQDEKIEQLISDRESYIKQLERLENGE